MIRTGWRQRNLSPTSAPQQQPLPSYARTVLGPIRVRSLIAAALLIAALFFLVREAARLVDVDFKVYLSAAEALLEGKPLYSGLNVNGLEFTYPPFAAAVFIPFSLLPPVAAFTIWTIVSVACLFAIAWLTAERLPAIAGRTFESRTWEVAAYIFAVSAFSETIVKNIELGQVNLALVLLVMFDTVSRAHYRGFLTGLAAGFKVAPAIFIVFMLFNRRWADFGRAVLGFATSLVIGSFFGVSQVWQFWTSALLDTTRVGELTRLSNMSALGMFSRWAPESTAKMLWLIVALAVGVLGLVIAAKWWKHSQLVAASVVGVTGLFVTPISWVHHFVWLIPVFCVVVALAIRGFRAERRLLGCFLVFTAAIIAIPELLYLRYTGEQLAAGSEFWLDIVGSGYPIICAIVITSLGVALKLRDPGMSRDLEPTDQEDNAASNRADTSSTDPMPST